MLYTSTYKLTLPPGGGGYGLFMGETHNQGGGTPLLLPLMEER